MTCAGSQLMNKKTALGLRKTAQEHTPLKNTNRSRTHSAQEHTPLKNTHRSRTHTAQTPHNGDSAVSSPLYRITHTSTKAYRQTCMHAHTLSHTRTQIHTHTYTHK